MTVNVSDVVKETVSVLEEMAPIMRLIEDTPDAMAAIDIETRTAIKRALLRYFALQGKDRRIAAAPDRDRKSPRGDNDIGAAPSTFCKSKGLAPHRTRSPHRPYIDWRDRVCHTCLEAS